MNKLPDNLKDHEGYPTEEYLEWLKKWEDIGNINQHLKEVLDSLLLVWWEPDHGIVIHKKRQGSVKVELHTGGHGVNEDIILHLEQNFYFWANWDMSRKGGHYYFTFNSKILEDV